MSTETKYGGGGNTQKGTSLNTAKLDAETEELKHKTVDLSVGKLIAQGDKEKLTDALVTCFYTCRETGQGNVSEGSCYQDM